MLVFPLLFLLLFVLVPVVPVVPVVPDVPEVSVDVVLVALVAVAIGTVESYVAVVAVVADADVSVETVSVLAVSSFLQPNAKSATASKAKVTIERDFFIARSPEAQQKQPGLQREDMSGSRSRGAILETS